MSRPSDTHRRSEAAQSKAVLQCSWGHLGRLRSFGFVLIVILYSGGLASQSTAADQDQTKPLRFDLTPLVGYRTGMLFPTGHSPSPHLVLGAKPSYGVAVGVRV